jgi:hypothetical protein
MNDQDNDEEMTALFGPAAKYSDHSIGETIRFALRGRQVEGEITWITAPSETVSGKHMPVTYICAVADEVWPVWVYQGEVLEL